MHFFIDILLYLISGPQIEWYQCHSQQVYVSPLLLLVFIIAN